MIIGYTLTDHPSPKDRMLSSRTDTFKCVICNTDYREDDPVGETIRPHIHQNKHAHMGTLKMLRETCKFFAYTSKSLELLEPYYKHTAIVAQMNIRSDLHRQINEERMERMLDSLLQDGSRREKIT